VLTGLFVVLEMFPVVVFPIIIRAVVYDETGRDVRVSALPVTTQECVPAAAAAAAAITPGSRRSSCRRLPADRWRRANSSPDEEEED